MDNEKGQDAGDCQFGISFVEYPVIVLMEDSVAIIGWDGDGDCHVEGEHCKVNEVQRERRLFWFLSMIMWCDHFTFRHRISHWLAADTVFELCWNQLNRIHVMSSTFKWTEDIFPCLNRRGNSDIHDGIVGMRSLEWRRDHQIPMWSPCWWYPSDYWTHRLFEPAL